MRCSAAPQVRAKVLPGRDCFREHFCYEDLPVGTAMFDEGNTSDYGHGVAEGHFKFWTADDLGANPLGTESACPISLRTFTSSGFIAIYQANPQPSIINPQPSTLSLSVHPNAPSPRFAPLPSVPRCMFHAQPAMLSVPCSVCHAQRAMPRVPCSACHAQRAMLSVRACTRL